MKQFLAGRMIDYNDFGDLIGSRPHTPGHTHSTHTQTMHNHMQEDHYLHHLQQEQEDQLLQRLQQQQQHDLVGNDMQDDEMMHHHHMQQRGDFDSDDVDQMQDEDYNEDDLQEEPLGFTASASKDPLMW